jgi:predicted HTH domain antitoxin
MENEAMSVGRELYFLANGRHVPANCPGHVQKWAGNRSTDAELARCRRSGTIEDVACLLTQEDPKRRISLREASEILERKRPETKEGQLSELLSRRRPQVQPRRLAA